MGRDQESDQTKLLEIANYGTHTYKLAEMDGAVIARLLIVLQARVDLLERELERRDDHARELREQREGA